MTFYDNAWRHGWTASHLALVPMPNVEHVRAHLLGQDVAWVWGGSVAGLLSMWRLHGLDTVLREAWEAGVVLTGISAGSICWHAGGTTDSFGPALRPVSDGLAFLPHSNGVHHDGDPGRRPLRHRLIADGTLPSGYATDDGAGLHYRGTDLHEVLTDPCPRAPTASSGAPTARSTRRHYRRGCSGRARRRRCCRSSISDRGGPHRRWLSG